ncbi:Dabb family protein [Williamsia sp. CHRR-6]|uniref:Dabb family protein n=1 Tax=Williamsia sp. CHRR-6 TaxID=2835871 RepID=UPI001BDA4283|nr:Dabb family protein [Williamsia sp. CHRR-6]MBT0568655.1 Dabb family protein [Williamsia sp. CHRR-6]
MIRNVVTGRLREPADDAQRARDEAELDAGLAGIAALELPGQLGNHVGRDLRLRDGGWDFAITNDWADAEAYRGYDTDPEHNDHRARIVEVCRSISRVQFEI